MNRRVFLLWAAAAMLALPGCAPDGARYGPPRRRRSAAYASTYSSGEEEYLWTPADYDPYAQAQEPQYVYAQPRPELQSQPRLRSAQAANAKVSAMSRNSWGAAAAVPAKMKVMNGVSRITIHHEGSKPNNDNSAAAVTATLRLIQSQHRQRMGAGDIGYHFIIDRTGAIWQGRDWRYQGAHASGANSNNLGVMLLGNFESQQPTARQVDSLTRLVASLIRKYGLSPRSDIYGHNDFCNTKCPGKNLKPYVASMRRSLQA